MHHADEQLALDERAGTLSSDQLFDTIGATYAATRPADPRIAARIWAALGDARTVVNVGAGTGAYEPSDREVTAVEPSAVMRAQRPADAAPCVAASAESLLGWSWALGTSDRGGQDKARKVRVVGRDG